jgi:hypothetical protein
MILATVMTSIKKVVVCGSGEGVARDEEEHGTLGVV